MKYNHIVLYILPTGSKSGMCEVCVFVEDRACETSGLVMKPVRCEAMEKSKGETILLLPSCFTGSPDHHCEQTPVQQCFLTLRPGTQT